MRLVKPSEKQLEECFKLEKSYFFHHENSESQGFFLPGSSFELYKDIASSGYVRCIEDEQGNVASFILALSPGHKIISNLLQNRDRTIIINNELSSRIDPMKSVWIAKIATDNHYRRKGLANSLFKSLLGFYTDTSIFTATALTPKRNYISEKFHHTIGMKPCGVYLGTTIESIENPVSLIWHR